MNGVENSVVNLSEYLGRDGIGPTEGEYLRCWIGIEVERTNVSERVPVERR